MDMREPAVTHPRAMLAAGCVLLAMAAAFAAVMRTDSQHPPTARVDQAWLDFVSKTRSPSLTTAFKELSLVGGPIGGTVIVAVVCVALLVLRRWRTALYLALAEAAGSACSQLVKHAVLRHRPPHPLVTADLGSFPSGHVITTCGVGLALAVAFTRPGRGGCRRYWLAAVATATALMIFCRTYLAAHWLSDTAEGLLIGAGVGLILWSIFDPPLARERHRPAWAMRGAGAGESLRADTGGSGGNRVRRDGGGGVRTGG